MRRQRGTRCPECRVGRMRVRSSTQVGRGLRRIRTYVCDECGHYSTTTERVDDEQPRKQRA